MNGSGNASAAPAEAAALNCGMGSQPGPDREGGGGSAAAVAGGAEVVSAAAPKRIGSACSTDRLSETSLIPASRATADVAEGSTGRVDGNLIARRAGTLMKKIRS